MRREEVDYVTPQTMYSGSLLKALGYVVIPYRKGSDRMEDSFQIFLDGLRVPVIKKGKKLFHIKRKDFFEFAKQNHKALRSAPLKRKIAYCIE